MKISTSQILSVLGLVGVLVVNFLANALPINGQTTAEISDRYPVLFTPAGYVFSIWGVIYLLLIAFVVYSFTKQGASDSRVAAVGPLFALSCLFNALWIFAWHYNQILLSLGIMLALLLTLIAIYLRIRRRGAPLAGASATWLVLVPFSVYLGWISVATIANVSALLYDIGWAGWGIPPATWTVIMLLIGAALALFAAYQRADVAYGIVFVWAFVGIGVRHGWDVTLVTAVSWGGAVVIAGWLAWIALSGRLRRSYGR